jgi:hypothetical protein
MQEDSSGDRLAPHCKASGQFVPVRGVNMQEEPPDDKEHNDEMSELYRALAHIRDDYISGAISHRVAAQRIQEAKTRYNPSWWQSQVMVLAIRDEFQRRVIRGLLVTIAILCVILMLLVFALVGTALHTP